MISKNEILKKCAALEKEYVGFLVKDFVKWEEWTDITRRIADGIEVDENEVPEGYMLEFKLMQIVLEMEATGSFDWNNPDIRKIFALMAQSPFYKLWGNTVTGISVELAEFAGVKTLVEIGAGRGNLTEIMLERLSALKMDVNLIVTDSSPIVIENIEKFKGKYPGIDIDVLLWDIKDPPANELIEKIEPPCLTYERASIMYTNISSIENIASFSDIIVFGDMFNYTGKLFAYDEIFKKIGVYPLLYSEMKPILDKSFKDHFMFDQRAQVELGYPNTTMLIGLK